MENNYKSYCELILTSDTITPEMITEETQMTPYRSFRKGEIFHSLKSGSEGIRKQNLWAIKSDIVISEEDDISIHILF